MTQHQPVPQSAPKKAARPATPGWSYLAHKLLQRLQDHEDLPESDADASDDDPTRMPNPTPPALTSRTLLTGLRLAASFGSQAAVNAAITPNAITLLRGVTAEDWPALHYILPCLLPAIWQIREQKPLDSFPTRRLPPRCLRLIPIGSGDRPADLTRLLMIGLDSAAPLLIVLAGGALPEPRLQDRMQVIDFAPVDAQVLQALLARTHPAGKSRDIAALHIAMNGFHPGMADLLIALRGATVGDVARNLSALRAAQKLDQPNLDAITGDSPALSAARAMVADLQLWRAGELGWNELTRTVLFHGPPGTGKSWLAQAMARSAGFAAVPASFGEWQAAGHLGDMLKAMRESFAEARRRAPAMLILDELDAVGTRTDRGPHQNYRVMVVNAFLALMDGIARDEGVVVVATCNHPELIDPAVLRPGRFDLRLAVPLPDAAALAGVLRRHVSLPESEIRALAQQAVGHSMADLDAALRDQRGEARRAGRKITAEDLRAAFGADDDPAMTRRIAIHECGHALVTAALGHGQIQHIALDRAGGQTRTRRTPRAGLIADHTDLMAELMAGRAAERLVFGTVSSGAGGPEDSDLALATRIALAIETRFGLGAEGSLWLGETTDWLHDKATRERLRARIEAAETQALAILTPHRALLEDMAQTLATSRELSGNDVAEWLDQVRTNEGEAAAPEPESAPSPADPPSIGMPD
ncbi:AAA family ATPase [Paracoccus sp. TOH]|uniref:AAA family ATPase n=1 Tax=Paracoccus sp. TOH TaxID=1263728 RepID=UPI0025AFFAEB|nr:AAA family ATPase [Paracoccus sp. TOH]WJS84183.1 AAA family ATPase [Paracoccus sp. TOH]